MSRTLMRACALSVLTVLTGAATTSAASAATPTPATPAVHLTTKRMDVDAGSRATVGGRTTAIPAGTTAALQVSRGGTWRTLDRARTAADGDFTLRDRREQAGSLRARVRVGEVTRSVGRLNVYRDAAASWYGPGLYGNRLGCGGTLDAGELGVAHKGLPCGAKVTIRHDGRTVRVPVIDRGPYVGGREFDLTEATAQAIGFSGHGTIQVTR